MGTNRILTGAAALVAAAGLVGTGAALSNAASTTPATASTSTAATPDGSANPNNDTPVTGTALANVTAAVKAKDSAVTVTSVRMDPDGSYDVFGTKAGANVRFEVSKDLKTITTGGGGGGHHGGGGGSNDTPVTGTALANVTAAVKANDSTVTVTSVRMDPDGSYDVFGTKAGTNVMLEVSKDLKTITANTGNGGQNG
jgi:hypothetical protein